MKRTQFLLVFLVAISSCKGTTDTTSTDNSNTPTNSYFKVDGTASNSGADAPQVIDEHVGVTKSFYFAGGHQINGALQIWFKNNPNLKSDVAEGTTKTFYIAKNVRTASRDSVEVLLEMDDYPTGIYELSAETGRVFLSKKNDTLRCTSDGVLTVTGYNNLHLTESQTRTLEFSIRHGVAF